MDCFIFCRATFPTMGGQKIVWMGPSHDPAIRTQDGVVRPPLDNQPVEAPTFLPCNVLSPALWSVQLAIRLVHDCTCLTIQSANLLLEIGFMFEAFRGVPLARISVPFPYLSRAIAEFAIAYGFQIQVTNITNMLYNMFSLVSHWTFYLVNDKKAAGNLFVINVKGFSQEYLEHV